MKLPPGCRRRLHVNTLVLTALTVAALVYTLIQWIHSEPDSFEPWHALAVLVLSVLSAISARFGRLTSKAGEEESIVASAPVRPNLGPLQRQMARYFDLAELRTLCFNLSVDYEELAGDTKSGKIISLLDYTERHGRLPELLTLLEQERSHVNWHSPVIPTTHELRSRENVLKNVHTTWIQGFLYQSLSHSIALELNLTYEPAAGEKASVRRRSQRSSCRLSVIIPKNVQEKVAYG